MGNPTEAGIAPSLADAPAPPPYTETDNARQYTNGSAAPAIPAPSYSEAGASTSTNKIAGVSNRFPPTLNAYLQKKGMSKTFHLGEHAETPLFSVSMHSGWTGKPMLNLKSGPNNTDPVLATANDESRWSGKNAIIQIFAPEEGSAAGSSSSSRSPQPTTTVKMTHKTGWRHATFSFSADVGLGKDTRREDFEWRHSRSEDIKELDKHSWGWKLVRLGSQAEGQGGDRATRSSGVSSDGKEIVAIWTMNGKWSMNKAFKFQYFGSALTGMMGERFAIVALMTALKMWYQEYVASTSAATAGAAGAGAAC
ncbi:hypothetical protein F5B20DRAFT_539327 [Whalleya microplaca]|nr:hypothetical protein F5B20DRAFT_539327 [Whalleya microplaca]